jgi:hypothetical protein
VPLRHSDESLIFDNPPAVEVRLASELEKALATRDALLVIDGVGPDDAFEHRHSYWSAWQMIEQENESFTPGRC